MGNYEGQKREAKKRYLVRKDEPQMSRVSL
jgi:hypothetical protein